MPVHRHLAPLSVGVAVVMAVSAGAVTAAEPVDTTAESVAVAAMLVPTDVARSAETNGISVWLPDDLPAFTEHAGLREAGQTIAADEGAVLVYDFRYQFPDAASAEAFLDAAEADLGEVAMGAERQTLPRSQRPLPDTRLYRWEDTLFGTGMIGSNYLMRLDNLVAKVYVSMDDQTASPEKLAAAIARAAAGRMRTALAGETPSAPPILRPTPSPFASPGPTSSASPSADAVTDLLSHVPAAMRDTCAADPIASEQSAPGVMARLTCPLSDVASVTFVAFGSAEAMDTAYDASRAYARVFGSFSSDPSCGEGGYDGAWSLGDVEAGRIICHELGGDALVVWSYPELRILSLIRQQDGDAAAAGELWLAAGPE